MVLALSPTTSVRRNANKDKVEDDTVFTITFTQTGQLRLIDPKNAVEVFLVPADQPVVDTVPEIDEMGMDPLAKPMAWTDFGRRILRLDGRLKTILCDDTVIVGLGDIYSDEILFEASLRYDRTGSSLNTQEVRRFFRSVVSVLNDAVKYRGTTIDAAPFVDPAGNAGNFQDHLQVFGKHGELSPRSRQPLVRSKFAGRWTYYCDQSQV
ncbi:MAG: formamidopyrimidine-DNA glycosylase [Ilumatobacter sp.]